MKLVVAGSRTLFCEWKSMWAFLLIHDLDIEVKEIVSGGARGIDECAKNMARIYEVPFKEFPADWNKHGKPAGHIRNKEMADYADALLLIWDGESRGSANMKMNMKKLNKPIYEVIIKNENVRQISKTS